MDVKKKMTDSKTVDCIQPCGCGKCDVRLYRDVAVHFRGKHWRIECIAETLMKELGEPYEICECDWLGPDWGEEPSEIKEKVAEVVKEMNEENEKETVVVPCDDDHFSSSCVELRGGKRIGGVWLKVLPQMGEPNVVYLHPKQIEYLIEALQRLKGAEK